MIAEQPGGTTQYAKLGSLDVTLDEGRQGQVPDYRVKRGALYRLSVVGEVSGAPFACDVSRAHNIENGFLDDVNIATPVQQEVTPEIGKMRGVRLDRDDSCPQSTSQ